MRYLPGYLKTCVMMGVWTVGLIIPGLLLHEILDRQLKVWSPFSVPYVDVGYLLIAVFVSAWWVARQSWAVAGRWAGVTILLPYLLFQVWHNLDPRRGIDPRDASIQIVLLLVLPVVLAFFAGDLGDRKRKQVEQEETKLEGESVATTEGRPGGAGWKGQRKRRYRKLAENSSMQVGGQSQIVDHDGKCSE